MLNIYFWWIFEAAAPPGQETETIWRMGTSVRIVRVRVSNNFRHFVYELKMRHREWVSSYRRHVFQPESSADYLKIPKTETGKIGTDFRADPRTDSPILRFGGGILASHLFRWPAGASVIPHSAFVRRAKNMKLKINLTLLCATLVGLLSIILLTQTTGIEAFGGGSSSSGHGATSCKELSKFHPKNPI